MERDKRLAALNQQAVTARQSGNLAAALAAWQAIQREESAYPNLAGHLSEVRQLLQQGHFQEGQTAEKAGDLVRSRRAYRRAVDVDDSNAEAQAALKRVQDRMAREGLEAFKRAETYENYQRLPEARRDYQKAFDYLPDDDPLKKEAKARLDRIGKQLE
jgi:tetratricopeptide (TPR) repeat protein